MVGFGLFLLGLVIGFGLAVLPCVTKLEEAQATLHQAQLTIHKLNGKAG